MINRSSRTKGIVLLTALIISGCRAPATNSTATNLARSPDVEKLRMPSNFAARALEATGGFKTWVNTKRLDLDCIVTLYQLDDSFYLTEQKIEVFPWSNSIRILDRQSQGPVMWQLRDGQLTILQGYEQVIPMQVSYRDYAEAILSLITAPARLLDASVNFKRRTEPIKIGGLWYDWFERTYTMGTDNAPNELQEGIESIKSRWDRVIYCQNKVNSFIDLLWFCKFDYQEYIAVRGYDYNEVEEKGILLPTKIEVFTTDARFVFKKRLLTIDIKLP
jgi:hypothetical protein